MDSQGAILIDHYKNPRQKGVVRNPDFRHEILNRKCGDHLRFSAQTEGNRVVDIRFEGEGCFYCLSSASIACRTLTGRQLDQVLNEVAMVRKWLLDECDAVCPDDSEVKALGEVKKYPMRIGCVDLAWQGVEDMLRREH